MQKPKDSGGGKSREFECNETMQTFKLQDKTKRKAPKGETNVNEPKRRHGCALSEEDAHGNEIAGHNQELAEENSQQGNFSADDHQDDSQEPTQISPEREGKKWFEGGSSGDSSSSQKDSSSKENGSSSDSNDNGWAAVVVLTHNSNLGIAVNGINEEMLRSTEFDA